MLVDSHCHLNYPDLFPQLDDVVERATRNGVKTLLTVNTRLSESADVMAIAGRFPNIFCSIGVHPHDATEHLSPDLKAKLVSLMAGNKVVALGETGLDYHYNHSEKKDQIASFEAHIEAAFETPENEPPLPLIIHTREADEDTIACLKNAIGQNVGGSSRQPRGVFHCFSGSEALANAAIDLGFMISLSGIITFKKSEELRSLVSFLPLDRLLVETDSPYLAPIPHRGKPNEPSFTVHVAEKLAEIKGVSYQEIAKITTDNFFRLFSRANRPENHPANRAEGGL